jgi:general secretion pathway protein L
MEISANFRQAVRNSAQRMGFPDFWIWWSGELRGLVPASVRHALQRRMLRPTIVFGPEAAELWEPQVTPSGVVYAQTAEIPLGGDPAHLAQAGRAAFDLLARRNSGVARVSIGLGPGQVLRKLLTYPAAAADNVRQVLGYDLDRHTPFKGEDLYFDGAIVARDAERGTIRVELVAALRSLVDQLRRQVAGWGGIVVGVVPGMPGRGPGASARRLDLLPEDEHTERGRLRSWHFWVPAAAFLLLVIAAVTYPLVQKRHQMHNLTESTDQARQRAGAADGVRQQLEQAVTDYNYVLTRKYTYPSALATIEDVTHLLPDDTWLTQLELKSTKGVKDPKREILLRGESGNAGRLVSLLEDSKLFEQAAPRSPTTKIMPGPGEIFDLGAQVSTAPLPATVKLADLGPVPQAGAAGAAAAANAPAPAAAAASKPATVAAGTPVPNPAPPAAAPAPAATRSGAGPTRATTPTAAPGPVASAGPVPAPPSAPPNAAPVAPTPVAPTPPAPAAPQPVQQGAPAFGPPPGGPLPAPPRAPAPVTPVPSAGRTAGQVQ